MATWHKISRDSLRTARHLLETRDEAFARSSISRSYYAAYSAITGALPRGIGFSQGRNNPSHFQVARFVKYNLFLSGMAVRRRVLGDIRFLWQARLAADYRPGQSIPRDLALHCFHRALYILRQTGVL